MTIAYSRNGLIRSVPKNPRVLDIHEVRTKFCFGRFRAVGKIDLTGKDNCRKAGLFVPVRSKTHVYVSLVFSDIDNTQKIVQRCTAFLTGM